MKTGTDVRSVQKNLQSFLLSAMLITAALSLAGCTAEYDPVKDFEKAISDRKSKSESYSRVTQGVDKQWHKERSRVINVRYDVKTTDSLVNPFAGAVTFTYLVESGDGVKTELDAKSTTVYPNTVQAFTASLTYAGSGKNWQMVDGSYFFNEEPEYKYPLSPERITTVPGNPFTHLKVWL